MKSLVAFIFATVIWEGALATPRGIYDSLPEETAILGFAPEVAPPGHARGSKRTYATRHSLDFHYFPLSKVHFKKTCQ